MLWYQYWYMHRLSIQHNCSFIAAQLHVSVHLQDNQHTVKNFLNKINVLTKSTLLLFLWDLTNYEKLFRILLCQLGAVIYDKTLLKVICVKFHIWYFDIYLHSKLCSSCHICKSALFFFSLITFVLMSNGNDQVYGDSFIDFSHFIVFSVFL